MCVEGMDEQPLFLLWPPRLLPALHPPYPKGPEMLSWTAHTQQSSLCTLNSYFHLPPEMQLFLFIPEHSRSTTCPLKP